MSVLTEHVNSSEVLAGFPLAAARPRQMGDLAPVLATPATAVAVAAGVAVSAQLAGVFTAGLAVGARAVGGTQPS